MVATSHDVMPDIELYQPTDEANALALANTLGSDGWLLAGGQDTFGWLKDRNKAAGAMIELTQIKVIQIVQMQTATSCRTLLNQTLGLLRGMC